MREFIESVEHYCKGLRVFPGASAVCSECISMYGIEDGDIDTMQEALYEIDESSFSWSQCDSCGSHLGGNRYSAHGLDSELEVYHLDICEDCLFFHANGDVPETWEG
jgi:hypothetical protein